ncbi:MAG: hypothetical protein AAGC73_01255 [Verrucomicrobiota bacterium]
MTKQHAITMWIIWFAMLQSAFIFPFFLGEGFPEGANAEVPMDAWIWVACFSPLITGTVLRWLVIPKMKEAQQMLVGLIIGMSFGEVAILLSIFLIGSDYPQNQIAVLIVAVLMLILMAPSYATPGVNPEKDSIDPA